MCPSQLHAGQCRAERIQLRAVLHVAGEHQPLHARFAERRPDQPQVLGQHRALRQERERRGVDPPQPVEIDERVGLLAPLQEVADRDRHDRLAGSHRARQEDRAGGRRVRHGRTIARSLMPARIAADRNAVSTPPASFGPLPGDPPVPVTRLRQVVDGMHEGVVVRDAEGTIVDLNPAAERILRRSRDQLIGGKRVNPRTAVHPDGSPFPHDESAASIALATGRDVVEQLNGLLHGRRRPALDLRQRARAARGRRHHGRRDDVRGRHRAAERSLPRWPSPSGASG